MAEKQTATFKDADGNKWVLRITIGSNRRVMDAIALDLNDTSDDGGLFKALASADLLGQLLWHLIAVQAEKNGITEDQFADALDGDVIEDAIKALKVAYINFSRPGSRKRLERMFLRMEQLGEAVANQAIETLEDPKLEKEILAEMSKAGTS